MRSILRAHGPYAVTGVRLRGTLAPDGGPDSLSLSSLRELEARPAGSWLPRAWPARLFSLEEAAGDPALKVETSGTKKLKEVIEHWAAILSMFPDDTGEWRPGRAAIVDGKKGAYRLMIIDPQGNAFPFQRATTLALLANTLERFHHVVSAVKHVTLTLPAPTG